MNCSALDVALLNQGYAILDDFLSPMHFHNLSLRAEHLYAKGHYRQAKVGQDKTRQKKIRTDEICWLDPQSSETFLQAYFVRLQAIKSLLNETLFLGLNELECHFALYPPGSFYRKHIDQFNSCKERQISCVYYLNSAWEATDGGELRLYDLNEAPLIEVLPQGNRFICFRSDLPHEVLETQKARYSIAGWMKTRPLHYLY